jgi:nucleoside-diphosphate-sugar epimerase
VLDLEAARAVIPGNGRQYVTYTHTRDVARFVALLLEVPGQELPEASVVVGDKIRLDDLVYLAKEITGEFTRYLLLIKHWPVDNNFKNDNSQTLRLDRHIEVERDY